MNRVEKEMAKKRAEAVKGLSVEEVFKLDQLKLLTKKVHFEMFPEEYDEQMDSISDANDRRRGKTQCVLSTLPR